MNCIGFFQEVTPKTAHALFLTLHASLMDSSLKTHLNISSPGGDTSCGFMLFNMLKDYGSLLVSHNVGRVDSAAVSIFLAAETRLAAPGTTFLIHRPMCVFQRDSRHSRLELLEKAASLKADEAQIVHLLSERAGIAKARARAILESGKVVNALEAKKLGLVQEIVAFESRAAKSIKIVDV